VRLPRAAAASLGALLGASAAAVGLALWPRLPSATLDPLPAVDGALVDEAEGPLEEIALHYLPEADPIVAGIYRAFLPSLDPETRVVALVAPGSKGADPTGRLRALLRSFPGGDLLAARVRVAVASGPLSPWSKDRALVTNRPGAAIGLWAPGEPVAAGERRRADWNAPGDLARAFGDELRASVLPLDFDAGDFAMAGGRLIVDANLIGKNAGRGLGTREKLSAALRQLFGLEVVVLGEEPGDVPRHHLSMYMTPLTDGVVLLGDPAAGEAIVGRFFTPGEASPDSGARLAGDFSRETRARYERAAHDLSRAGFRVVRIPTVVFDDKTYFAYTNGVFETRNGRRIAWVPTFDLPALDSAAMATYRSIGWEPRPVPSRPAFPYHGTLGCLVNVLARGRR